VSEGIDEVRTKLTAGLVRRQVDPRRSAMQCG
jgi:hypothetical protein